MAAGRVAVTALAAIVTGALGAVGAHIYNRSAGILPAKSGKAGPLSAKRKAIIDRFEEVIPSAWPDAKFKRLAPSYQPDDPAWRERIIAAGANPDTYTTCGEGPRFALEAIGINTHGGLKSVRDEAEKHGAWVVAGGDRRPKPGDAYLLGDRKTGAILHTGIIKDASGTTWKTLDSGQGGHPNQAAAEVPRPYDAAAVTLGGPAGPRDLLGWMDVGRMPDGPARA